MYIVEYIIIFIPADADFGIALKGLISGIFYCQTFDQNLFDIISTI